MAAKDFNTALRQAGMGEYVVDGHGVMMHRKSVTTQQYKPPKQPTNIMKQRTSTPVQTTPAAIWPEYAQKQATHPYTYSPIEHKQRRDYARSAFDRMEHILLNAYKGME